MKGRYVTPRKAFADQHAGVFFWSIFRSFLEIRPDLTVSMYDEFLAGHEIAASETEIRHRFRGKVTSGVGSEKCQIHLQSEDDDRYMMMTVLQLRDGQLICEIHTTSWDCPRTELFEPA